MGQWVSSFRIAALGGGAGRNGAGGPETEGGHLRVGLPVLTRRDTRNTEHLLRAKNRAKL